MDNSQINAIITIVVSFVLLAASFRFFGAYNGQRKFNSTRFIARVAIFGAFASILYVVPIFTINLPFIPSFLSLHFDEIPCFIAGFAYGPLSGIFGRDFVSNRGRHVLECLPDDPCLYEPLWHRRSRFVGGYAAGQPRHQGHWLELCFLRRPAF